MARDVVAQLLKCSQHIGMLLKRRGHTKDGEWQFALFKFTQQTPHPCTRAIFINALHADVPIWVRRGVEHF